MHYPPDLVDTNDPFILLVHQGMIEEIFLDDLNLRDSEVIRNSPFVRYSSSDSGVEVECDDLETGKPRQLRSQFVVGCDGAHSKVRKSMQGAEMDGASGNSAWGVLDGKLESRSLGDVKPNKSSGVIETDFPDLWSKAVISSETAGSILCIPRERNMTRLYIELHPNTAPVSSEAATEEFVMRRAKEIISPFTLSWKTVGVSTISNTLVV